MHGALSETEHLLMNQDLHLKLAGFSSAISMRNMNDARVDLEGMGLALVTAALGRQTSFEPQVASQNPRLI